MGSFDIVHIHSLYSYPTFRASRAALQAGVPYIIRPHGTLTSHHWDQKRSKKFLYELLIERKTLKCAGGVHFVSTAEMNDCRLAFGKGYVVPLGVSLPPSRDPRGPESPIQIGYLGRLATKKRPHQVIDVLAGLLAQGVTARASIAGSEQDISRAELMTYARRIGVEEFVDVQGFLSGSAKTRFLDDTDFFLLPSVQENFSLAALESAAHGAVLVTTKEVAIGQDMMLRGAALVASTPSQMVKSIRELVRDPPRKAAMQHEARRAIVELYSWSRVGSEMRVMYEDVLRRAG